VRGDLHGSALEGVAAGPVPASGWEHGSGQDPD